MTDTAWFKLAAVLGALLLLARPLGGYMARVYEGKRTFLDPVLRPLERALYRLAGVRPEQEMDWQTYAGALVWFSAVGMLVVYAQQRLQAILPLNPQHLGPVPPDLAFNTAASYVSATEWQNFGGESTVSYLTQMAGFAPKAFVSGAGMAIMVAFIRGLARASARTIGNFWVDLVRGTLYVFLPLAAVLALVLVSQGSVQTLSPYHTATLLQPTAYEEPVTDAAGKPVLSSRRWPWPSSPWRPVTCSGA